MIAPTSIVAAAAFAISGSSGDSMMRWPVAAVRVAPCTRSYQEMTMLSKSR
jgi:hypothetical protein